MGVTANSNNKPHTITTAKLMSASFIFRFQNWVVEKKEATADGDASEEQKIIFAGERSSIYSS